MRGAPNTSKDASNSAFVSTALRVFVSIYTDVRTCLIEDPRNVCFKYFRADAARSVSFEARLPS